MDTDNQRTWAHPAKREHFVISGITQLILVGLLAPGDGGTLLHHAVVVLVLVHIGFYLVHFSIPSGTNGSLAIRLTQPELCFMFSLVGVILMTIAITTNTIPIYFGLAG